MKTSAIILARAGSKGVLNKNKIPFGKGNLISRAINTLKKVKTLDNIVISSDDDEILAIADLLKVEPYKRKKKHAKDNSTSEDAIKEVIDNVNCGEIIVLAQCTSPFINYLDIEKGIKILKNNTSNASTHSVREFNKFIWEEKDGNIRNLIESSQVIRKPRQTFNKKVFIEDGAFYIFNKKNFLKTKNRFSKNIKLLKHTSISGVEIDNDEDLQEAYRVLKSEQEKKIDLSKIKLVITDFDGVHTTGKVSLTKDGKEKVEISRLDGKGIQLMKEKGIEVIILTAEKGGPAIQRAKKLSLEIFDDSKSKIIDLKKILEEKKYSLLNIAYLGDDDADLLPMSMVGFSACPKNASSAVKKVSHHISSLEGGSGFIREISDILCSKVK